MKYDYRWQPAYVAAILEQDKTRCSNRIYEAMAAIEERLLDPIPPSGKEIVAIRNAQDGIERLTEEMRNRSVHKNPLFGL